MDTPKTPRGATVLAFHGRGRKPLLVNPRDLITKSAGARLRGMTAPSFFELVQRYPDKLRTVTVGGVEFVFRSQVRRFKTDSQRRRERQERAQQ